MKLLAVFIKLGITRAMAQEMSSLLLNYFCINFTVHINFVALRKSVKTTAA